MNPQTTSIQYSDSATASVGWATRCPHSSIAYTKNNVLM